MARPFMIAMMSRRREMLGEADLVACSAGRLISSLSLSFAGVPRRR